MARAISELLQDVAEREILALDAYSTLQKASQINSKAIEDALLQMAETSISSVASRPTRPGVTSLAALKDILNDQYVHEFVTKYWTGRLIDFDDFVRLYNLLIDRAHSGPKTQEASVEPQVLAMVEASRQSRGVRGNSPYTSPAMGAGRTSMRSSMAIVSSSEEVPEGPETVVRREGSREDSTPGAHTHARTAQLKHGLSRPRFGLCRHRPTSVITAGCSGAPSAKSHTWKPARTPPLPAQP